MSKLYTAIIGHEKLTAIYGQWPTFHDAEIVSIHFDRGEGRPLNSPSITVLIHVFRIDVTPDASNRDDRIAALHFRGVESVRLCYFNNQNSILGFGFLQHYCERLRRQVFDVEIPAASGAEFSFQCNAIEVLSIEPMNN
jgi:hypothetical protein